MVNEMLSQFSNIVLINICATIHSKTIKKLFILLLVC